MNENEIWYIHSAPLRMNCNNLCELLTSSTTVGISVCLLYDEILAKDIPAASAIPQ